MRRPHVYTARNSRFEAFGIDQTLFVCRSAIPTSTGPSAQTCPMAAAPPCPRSPVVPRVTTRALTFPQAHVVGVDLDEDLVAFGDQRAVRGLEQGRGVPPCRRRPR